MKDQNLTVSEKSANEQTAISQNNQLGGSLLNVIAACAASDNIDIDKMQKLLDMQERIVDKSAKAAYGKAMAEAQNIMPVVAKKSQNKQTNSTYAKLEDIIDQCAPVWTSRGFSLSFGTEPSSINGFIKITCTVSHSEGHTERREFDLPIDNTGIKGTVNKTVIHGIGSTVSYGRRYLTCLVFNIPTGDDSDGNTFGGGMQNQNRNKGEVSPAKIVGLNYEELTMIETELDAAGVSHEEFCKKLKLDELWHLSPLRLSGAINYIKGLKKNA